MSTATDWFPGGGDMGERVRAFDWSNSPLGAIESWPQSLRTVVRIMLDSRYPMFVWWGPDLINLYNDSYAEVLGQRHPQALGQSGKLIWREIWDDIAPLVRTVVEENKATFNSELELIMERNGYLEETYFTFSYSPLVDDESGERGLFCACLEDTERVIGERRLRLLSALGGYSRTVHTVTEALRVAHNSLREYQRDVAFALVYLHDETDLILSESVGLNSDDAIGIGIAPECLRAVFDDGKARLLVAGDVDVLMPGGAWPEPAHAAMVLPLSGGGEGRSGVVVLGACPRRAFDDSYRQFFELTANAISSLLANADAYENERRRADALAELDRAKTVFFGNVSHEFRTPLTLMLAPIEDVLELVTDPAVVEPLRIARRNGLRMIKLVNTLLDFSRIEAGRIDAHYEGVDLAQVTGELASMFRSALAAAGLKFEVEIQTLSERVWVDRDMWEKIVLNLLSNALKYTLQGTVRIALEQRKDDVVLTVSDSGIGIPPDELPRIFDRFHRVEGAHGRTQEGTGIGLALVRELCHLHGGKVSVDSVAGQGSTFRVSIPMGHAHLPAEQVAQSDHSASTSIGVAPFLEEANRWLPDSAVASQESWQDDNPIPDGERPRVLIADDNADMRAYLHRLLSPRYEVLVAADGQHAAELAQEKLPDLVLSDVMMPGLDGFQLIAQLRANETTRAIPFVLLSARAGEEARAEGLEAGADDYMVKPFQARELLARVGAQIQLAGERRGAQARITSVIEGSTTGFTTLDAEGRYSYVNAAAERLVGRNREDMLGLRPEEVFPEARGTDTLALTQRVLESRVPEEREVYFEPWQRWFRVRLEPTADGGLSSQFDDTTLTRKAMETMRETDRRKDEFLATLAHELRNPLAPIRNALQLLLDRQPEDPHKLYRMMGRQTDQLTRLVDDLMEVSRINRGKVELRREPMLLAEAINSACETVQPSIEHLNQTLQISIPEEALWVDADPVRLAQVVANLLGNASKYTPDGGRIGVTLRGTDAAVEIIVTDDGIGLSSDQLESIFEPFLQAGHVEDRDPGGLGLGLTVVRELVERHDGRVEVASGGAGKGSTFRVLLPRCDPVAVPDVPAVPTPAARSQQPSVLVVDDNRDAANSLGMLLKIKGCVAHVVYDGNSALAAVTEHNPDVIILDIGLPDIDGNEVARRIRARDDGAARTIIALTGWGQPSAREQSSAAGFDHHLVKPADWLQLQDIIATHDPQ